MKNKINDIQTLLIPILILIVPIIVSMIMSRVNMLRVCLIEIIIFIIAYFIKKKVNKQLKIKPTFNEQYYRDIPEVKPALLLYYLNKNDYEIRSDFYATILDMINRGYFLLKKDENTLIYKININEQMDFSKLSKYENHLIKLLFFNYNRNEVDFSELKRNIEEDKLFQERIDAWKTFVELEAKEKQYKINNSKLTIIKKICEILLILTCSMNFLLLLGKGNVSEIIYIINLGILIVSSQLWLIDETNFTIEVVNEMEKSKALKRYLEDYSLIVEKKFEHIILWEGFLVYATILDTPKNIKKFFDNIFR